MLPFNWTIWLNNWNHIPSRIFIRSVRFTFNQAHAFRLSLFKYLHRNNSTFDQNVPLFLVLLGSPWFSDHKQELYVCFGKKKLFTLPLVQPMDSFCQEKEGIWKMILKWSNTGVTRPSTSLWVDGNLLGLILNWDALQLTNFLARNNYLLNHLTDLTKEDKKEGETWKLRLVQFLPPSNSPLTSAFCLLIWSDSIVVNDGRFREVRWSGLVIQDNWINWTLGKPDPSHELNSDNYLDWILIMWDKITNEVFKEVGDKNACKCLKSLKKVHLNFVLKINNIITLYCKR